MLPAVRWSTRCVITCCECWPFLYCSGCQEHDPLHMCCSSGCQCLSFLRSGVDDTTSGSSDSPPEDQKRAASGASASASVPTADIESLIPKLEWEPPRCAQKALSM